MLARHGFTLVEVLVALLILGIGLAAALRASTLAVDSARENKLRLLATWMAEDKLNQMRAQTLATRVLPSTGESRENRQSAGLEFVVLTRVANTPNAAFRKLDVQVSQPAESHFLVNLKGYAVLPLGATTP